MSLLDPTKIHVARAGSGPPVILLHGINATRRMWDGLTPLGSRFELLSYDLPGHGAAEAPGGRYEIEDLSEQLGELMTDADISRAHLIGSSIGGMIALHFAATWPGRVDRLVLCDTSPALSEGMRDALLTAPESDFAYAAMARADLMDFAEEIHARTLVLCANGACLDMREGADFLARSIPGGQLAFVPGALADAVTERPDWVVRVLLDFLG